MHTNAQATTPKETNIGNSDKEQNVANNRVAKSELTHKQLKREGLCTAWDRFLRFDNKMSFIATKNALPILSFFVWKKHCRFNM